MSQDRKRLILIILLCGVLITSSVISSLLSNNKISNAIRLDQVAFNQQKDTIAYDNGELNTFYSKITPALRDKIKNAYSNEYFDVIVSTLPSRTTRISRSLRFDYQIQHSYEIVPAFNGIMSKQELETLSQNPDVVWIEPNLPVFEMMETARPASGVDWVYDSLGIDGSGIRVAVIDSGIDDTHVDLAGRVVGWKDFINDQDAVYDDRGHGTHIAGIIAGLGNQNSDRRGIAPGADLLGVKILDENGQGTLADVIAGIEWSVKNDADVINLSLGTRITGDGTTATDMAVNRAVELGSTVVVSAGNFGPNGSQTIGIPGTAEYAITVGAVVEPAESSSGSWEMAAISSLGPTLDGRIKPDICAPGESINSAFAPSIIGNTFSYRKDQGTSMSSAIVSGIVALTLQRNRSLNPADIKNLLTDNADPLDSTTPIPNNIWGFGRVNARTAILEAGDFSSPGDPPNVRINTPSLSSIYSFGDLVHFSIQVSEGDDSIEQLLLYLPDDQIVDLTGDIVGELAEYDWSGTINGTIEARVYCRDTLGRVTENNVLFYVNSSADVLIIDDSLWGEQVSTYYEDTLDNYFYSHLIWDSRELGPPDLATIAQNISAVIWSTGSADENTLTEEEQTEISKYLTNDGKLMLVGQDLAFDLNSTKTFLNDVLYADFESDEAPSSLVIGEPGDPISDDLHFRTIGGDGIRPLGVFSSPDSLIPLSPAETFLSYEDGTAAGVRLQEDNTKLIFLPFNFAAIDAQNARNKLLGNSINWLTGIINPHTPPNISIISPYYKETLKSSENALIVVDASPPSDISSIEYKIYSQTSVYQEWKDSSGDWNDTHYEIDWFIPIVDFPIPSIVEILIRIVDNSNAYSSAYIRVYIREGEILVINGDRNTPTSDGFVTSLDNSGMTSDIWSREDKGTISLELMSIYEAVVWKTGKDKDEGKYRLFTDLEIGLLTAYMQNGGDLLLCGDYITLNYRDYNFLRSTLGVVFRGPSSIGSTTLHGTTNSFLDSQNFDISNSQGFTIDYTHDSSPLLVTNAGGNELTVGVVSGHIKTGRCLFFAFDPSDIASNTQRDLLVEKSLDFLVGNLPYCEITSPDFGQVYKSTAQLTLTVSIFFPEPTTILSEVLTAIGDQQPVPMTQGSNATLYSKTLSLSVASGITSLKVIVSDQSGNKYLASTRIFVESNDFILVDDDGTSFWEDFYIAAFQESSDSVIDHWDSYLLGEIPSTILKDYSYCIWFTGSLENQKAISDSELENIKSYLVNGGKFFVSGEGIEQNLEIFNARRIASSTAKRTVYGDPSSPVIPQMMELGKQDSAMNTLKPSVIEPLDSSAVSLAYYNEDGTEIAGIGFKNNTYALVFFAFNFESLGTSTDRTNVLARIIQFLDGTLEPSSISSESKSSDGNGNGFIGFSLIPLLLGAIILLVWRVIVRYNERRKVTKIDTK